MRHGWHFEPVPCIFLDRHPDDPNAEQAPIEYHVSPQAHANQYVICPLCFVPRQTNWMFRIRCNFYGLTTSFLKITINTLVKIKHRSPWQRLSRGGTGPFASPKIPLGSVALEKVTNMFTRCCFESRFGSLMANSTGGHWRKCHDPTLGVECRCDTKHCLIWATVPQYRCLRARMSQCTAQKYPNPWA